MKAVVSSFMCALCSVAVAQTCGDPATASMSFTSGSVAIPDGGEAYVSVTMKDASGRVLSCTKNPSTLTIKLTKGTGSAGFPSGTSGQTTNSLSIPGSTTVIPVGLIPSSLEGNIALSIVGNVNGAPVNLTPTPFQTTVVGVVLTLHTSGQIASDDEKRANADTLNLAQYITAPSADSPGFVCVVPYEVQGIVTPSTYSGLVTIKRYVSRNTYNDPNDSPVDSKTGDDTSLVDQLDQSPAPIGNVYDWDGPGAGPTVQASAGAIVRYRAQFLSTVVIGDISSTFVVGGVVARPSASLNFYVRSSCRRTSTSAAFSTDIPNDNQVALGSTKLTRTLQ